jgi:TPP-dependent pyruvate/acetoin dehydrogenase alpha subunit
VFHEGLNFAGVQKLGLVLVVENNLWAYSTPVQRQVAVDDLALRARGYGVPAIIVDGTDPLQVFDAAREACDRAHAGEGPTLIESKLMRMKGHAIHDAAAYVPPQLFQYWQLRDPITRFENYLEKKGWLSKSQRQTVASDVEEELRRERAAAEASPMPDGALALKGVYCGPECHAIRPHWNNTEKAGNPRTRK